MTKTERELKKQLKQLTEHVALCLAAIDREMRQPSTPERGKGIANISNALELENDTAMHFGLGLSFKQIENVKAAAEKKLPK